MRTRLAIVVALAIPVLGLAACATPSSLSALPPVLAPMLAIERAAAFAPGAYPGVFAMTIRASGRQDGRLYLNSETDYRDQRNVSLEIAPVAQGQLENQLGAPVETALQGRRIEVEGEARRVRIDFMTNGRPTGKYYYQTQILIARGEQLRVVD